MLHSITMKKVGTIIISLTALFILGAVGLFITGYFSPKPGGIRVETDPKASVFINGELVGETPYQGSYKSGKIILKLVPEGSSENLVPFETTLTIKPGIQTAVQRIFKASEAESLGYIISFEKNNTGNAGLLIMSDPENAQVLIDGVSRGFTSYSTNSISPAMHTITIKSPGYLDFSTTIKTIGDYRLTFFAKLGTNDEREVKTNQITSAGKKVKILNTPTGYLRVRTEPSENGQEIAEVKPGEEYSYIDTDIASGWIEIQYQASKSGLPAGITGWISGKYASVSGETI